MHSHKECASFCDGISRDQFIYFAGDSFLMEKNYFRGTGMIFIGSAKLSVSKTTGGVAHQSVRSFNLPGNYILGENSTKYNVK